MENNKAYLNARKKVAAKLKFKTHLWVYIAVIVLLFVINITTSTEYMWFKWPLLGWGIGLALHALNVYVYPNSTTPKEEMIKRQMEKDAKGKIVP